MIYVIKNNTHFITIIIVGNLIFLYFCTSLPLRNLQAIKRQLSKTNSDSYHDTPTIV